MPKAYAWISVATFIGTFAGSLLFAPRLPSVRFNAPTNMETMPSHNEAAATKGTLSVKQFNWEACAANQKCIKAMGEFYSTVAKPMYPIIGTK